MCTISAGSLENGSLNKEELADKCFVWHNPPQFEKNEELSSLFSSFRRDLASALVDHLEEFAKRLAERNSVSELEVAYGVDLKLEP